MESTILSVLLPILSLLLTGIIQFKNNKAEAKKTTSEASSIDVSTNISKEDHSFAIMSKVNEIVAGNLIKTEEAREKLQEKVEILEASLSDCKKYKEKLCEERIDLIKKLQKYEPDYKHPVE